MSGDPYSRLIGVLKVALPLVALALLSTLFLFSDRIEIGSSIPFAEGEITERVEQQQVTAPVFAGATTSGDLVTFRADQLVQDGAQSNTARNVTARVVLTEGGQIAMVSDAGTFNVEKDEAQMTGNVLIESSTGYRMRTDLLTSQFSELNVRAPGEVRATGPAGKLTAGAMHITAQDKAAGAQLLFTGGVKLIYDPKQSE